MRMNYFIRQATNKFEDGEIHPSYIQEESYGILELQIYDFVFSIYVTYEGRQGDYCFSMKTGLDLSEFIHQYNELEDAQLSFLESRMPTLINLFVNTALKGYENDFFDKPFFRANDIVNGGFYSWPIKYKIEVNDSLGEYIMSHYIPMLCYAIKLMNEIYNFSDIPFLSKNELLSTEGQGQEALVKKAYIFFKINGFL